uniref:KRAB domain-containing protein n=1 Tax=Pelusios castaneus TaxID=367368 RepID=A0A8C8VKS3_9SAUR
LGGTSSEWRLVLVAFKEVAMYFSWAEWGHLAEEQRQLYRDIMCGDSYTHREASAPGSLHSLQISGGAAPETPKSHWREAATLMYYN